MTPVHCPKCEADISDTYEPADWEVGIVSGGWFCEKCNVGVTESDVGAPDEDVRDDELRDAPF